MEVGVEMEEAADQKKGGAAAHDVEGEAFAGFSASEARDGGVDDGAADEQEEDGKDEVGEGEAVPIGVIELGVGYAAVARVVDEDHEGDGEAAQDVDGEH